MTFDPLIIPQLPDPPNIGPVRLPAPLTTLVGREKEIAELVALVKRPDVRFVTVTGTGGVGKTRIAVEVANRVKTDFVDGQYFISLNEIDAPEEMAPVVLNVLSHYHAPGATEILDLADAMTGKNVLLILNGAEVVAEQRKVMINLLEFLPAVTALLTSRVPMRVRGEHEYPLPPLPLPDAGMSMDELLQVPSVQLFLNRARSVRPSFTLNEGDADGLVRVLQRLDGLPSAIELAAFRTRLFPLRVIQERMESLLDFLSGGPHDLPSRLQNMRSVIQWGYDLLAPREQRIFRTLSTFEGAFSFEAATHVLVDEDGHLLSTSAVMDGLAQMLDHSVITPVTLVSDDAGYRMLVTTREFGRELLDACGERDEAQERVLTFYLFALKKYAREVYGPDQPALLARLDFFADNLHSALRIARDQNAHTDIALRIATRLAPYWLLRGMAIEGSALLSTFLERANNVSDLERARACRELGSLNVEMNEIDLAHQHFVRALDLYERAGHRQGIVDTWHDLGVVAMKMSDLDEARTLLTRSLEARREQGDDGALAQSLSDMGDLAIHDGDLNLAREMQEEAYRIHLRMGNRLGIVCDCVNLLMGALLHEPSRPSDEWYRIGARFADDINDRHGRAQLQLAHAMLTLNSGDSMAALADIAEALRVLRASESRRLMLDSLPLVAEVCVWLGDDRMAAQVMGATSHMSAGSDRFAWYRGKRRARAVEQGVQQRLGDGEFARFTMLGAYQSVGQTIEAILEMIEQALDKQSPRDMPVEEELPRDVPALTGRETEVLSLVAQGLSDKVIAETLRISPRTAMTHVSNIMAKMDVHSRSAASELGIRLGLVSPPRDDVNA